MSNPAENPPPTRRDRSAEARKAARLKKAAREARIINQLNGGASIAELAAREGVTERRIRMMVREILARRMPPAPAEFAALQVSRLNEALLVSYSAMSGTNLEAVDRVVRIVRELDRYGFVAADWREDAGERPPRALPAPAASRKPMAPQSVGNIRSAEGNGRFAAPVDEAG